MTMLSTPLRLDGLAPAHCDVWRVDLDQGVTEARRALLSPAERERTQRFVFARDRHRFATAHAALREVLALHTGQPGAALDLAEGPLGKPWLAGPAPAGPGTPHFNLSHSQGIGLIALSATHEVGIDVEMLRPMSDRAAMARTYFTPLEQSALAYLETLDAIAAEHAFFICWTRKEACLKALGLGLQLATDSFEVGVDIFEGAARDIEIDTLDGVERVRLRSFACAPDAVGALALRLPRRTPFSASAWGATQASETSA
jgi:4'-phosphopantetheinyl transferase